jgi:hypothetical protein
LTLFMRFLHRNRVIVSGLDPVSRADQVTVDHLQTSSSYTNHSLMARTKGVSG